MPCQSCDCAAYQLPKLPYAFDALEPFISKEIMEIHYLKHHQAYVNNLKAALDKYALAEEISDLPTMIALDKAIKFNGGGHINHSIFWTNLAPKSDGGGTPPSGALAKAITTEFGSIDKFIETFNSIAVAVQGSGWCWLAYCKLMKRLEIVTCANQDPCSTTGKIPTSRYRCVGACLLPSIQKRAR
jgi:superoxide dismutase, Fe-Mn family